MKIRQLGLGLIFSLLLCLEQSKAYHLFYAMNGATPVPVRWQATGIVFTADTDGPAGQNFTALCTSAVTTWNNVTDALDVFGTPVTSTVNYTSANLHTAWGNLTGDGHYELVYDADGAALSALGYDPAITNGYAPRRQRVVGGQGVIDDAFFIVNGLRSNFHLLSTLVHELGHIQGLAHSSVGMHNSASPDTALDKISLNSVPTMHPFSLGTGNTARSTLEPDDKAALRELYPEAGATARWASIAGQVRRCGSNVPVKGVSIRAVSTADTNVQISRFTSYDGNVDGRYVINFIPAGDYRIVVEPLGANDFTLGRFGNPPSIAENDFDFEYLSPTDVEMGCAEETPEVGSADIATLTTTNASTRLADDVRVGGPELAFVIDDTGSMGQEISGVRAILNATITVLQAASVVRPFPQTAIITFKDDVTKRIVSNKPSTLRTVVDSLGASGGNDCPEASNAALLVAGRILRQKSVALLFTDADTRPDGPSRAEVTSLFRAKGVRLFTLLSGTCTGSITPSISDSEFYGTGTRPMRPMQYGSENEEFPSPPVNGAEPAVATFSIVSNSTGGFFVAIPGINSGDSDEITRYTNTGTNLSVSAVLPALALVTPTNAPQATNLNIEVSGSNTNFIDGQSTLSFAGGGITVNSIAVFSPTRLTANLTIAADAAFGFRDATVITNLGATNTEEAKGIGVINITETPIVPTTLSATPPQGGQGLTLDVTISAAAVAFTDSSVADFGPGISIVTNHLINPTTLMARVQIASDATIGYRRISVFTPGGPTAQDDSPAGAFQVTIAAPVVPVIQSLSPNHAQRGSTVDIAITGSNTSFSPGTTVSFGGTGIAVNTVIANSPTSLTANITVAPDAPLGFRDVTATTSGQVAAILDAFQVVAVQSRPVLNLSARMQVQTGDNVLIGGFILVGTEPKKVILRAIGPTLGDYGVPDSMADPMLSLYDSAGAVIATNDNWKESQQAEIEATTLAPASDLESAIVTTLPVGAYTAIVSGMHNTSGVGLVELYDLNLAADSLVANVSSRGFVGTDDDVMIGGLIVGVTDGGQTKLLARAMGPSLSRAGVAGRLEDPTLDVHNSDGMVITSNDDWQDTEPAMIAATGLAPHDSRESALITSLSPGAYTAILRGKGNTVGLGILEVYVLP